MKKIKQLTPQSRLRSLVSGDIVNLLGISYPTQDELGIIVDGGRRRDQAILVALAGVHKTVEVTPFFVSSPEKGNIVVEGDGRFSYREGSKTYRKYSFLLRRFQQ